MSSARAFRVLRDQSDRVSLRQIAAIALTCVGLGLGLSRAAEHARPSHGDRKLDGSGQRTTAEPLQAALIAWPMLVPPAKATNAPAHAQAEKPRLRFARERVSYLRCRRAGCTRVPALEKQVWRALSGLASCYAETTPGRAELQLELRRDRAPEIALVPPARGPSLNLRAVRGCVEGRLRALPERFSEDPKRVSFRFGLR